MAGWIVDNPMMECQRKASINVSPVDPKSFVYDESTIGDANVAD
jgi:hypothetical protein